MDKPIKDSDIKNKNAYYNLTSVLKKKLGVQYKPTEKPLKINMSFNREAKKAARPKIK
ncbi:hypothetical protein H7X68_01230 [Candidatus Saccharibacteria bacterium]|nr:hypothetical protein [Candidatus Saccharibacteria bacterium]